MGPPWLYARSPMDRNAGGKPRIAAWGIAAVTVVSAAVLLTGCSFSFSIGQKIEASELEKQVRLSYEDQTGIVITSIRCDEADASTGSPISCEATNASDVELEINGEVTFYDAGTEEVDFDWEVTRAEAPGEIYAEAAAVTIRQQFGVLVETVQCPDRILIEVGARVPCTAIEPSGERTPITLTLTDKDGGFRVSVDSSSTTAS